MLFSRTKTDLHNKYMIYFCVWLTFWTKLANLIISGFYGKIDFLYLQVSQLEAHVA